MPALPLTTLPVRQGPIAPAFDPQALTSQMGSILNQAIPGYSGLSAGASGVVNNLLGGNPSTGPVRRENAYYGISSGMPGSDYVRNRGADIYQEKADAYRSRGFDDFLKLLQGASGTSAPSVGQVQQGDQFQQSLQQRQIEANQAVARGNVAANSGGGGGSNLVGHGPVPENTNPWDDWNNRFGRIGF